MAATPNADLAEIAKFDAVASSWWDPQGEFRPLHDLNPARLDYIDARVGLAGRRVLDVGCGGGLLAEGMARRGARVTGIDLSPQAVEVARLHAIESKVDVDYRVVATEALAVDEPGAFDLVTCLEMLEHVPDPAAALAAIARLVRPDGDVILSTIDRSVRSFALAIVAAEYVLRLLPRGTHRYDRLIRPSELCRWARAADLTLVELAGLTYNPATRQARIVAGVSVNYLGHFRRQNGGAAA